MSSLIETIKTDNIINANDYIKEEDDMKECIICLQNNNQTIKYSGLCQCNPFVHKECLDEWYKVYPNLCPICRNQNNPNNLIIINRYTNERCVRILIALCCLMSCACLIVPIIMFIIITSK